VVGAASCQYYHVERKRIDLYTVGDKNVAAYISLSLLADFIFIIMLHTTLVELPHQRNVSAHYLINRLSTFYLLVNVDSSADSDALMSSVLSIARLC